MRDFNFKDDANTGAADIAGIRPQVTPPEILKLDETPREDSLRPFHVEQENEESSNLPKIVGAVVVGLLIVGGGLYAYETTFANHAPVKTVAMNTTAAPTNMAATTPSPSPTPDTSSAPSRAAPVATPAPSVKSATATPAPKTELSKTESAKIEPAQQSASNAPGVGIGPTNDPTINAPMTLTPENAPAPQSGASSQTAETAMQQPITAPNVGNTSQPTASVAANQASGVTVPSTDTSNAPPAQPTPAPTVQVTQQPAQLLPAQIQPAQIQPSQPAAQ
jgi:hypothetical protein